MRYFRKPHGDTRILFLVLPLKMFTWVMKHVAPSSHCTWKSQKKTKPPAISFTRDNIIGCGVYRLYTK